MDYFDFTGKVVIEFYTTGCLNCQMMSPIIANLEHLMPDIRFYRVNADIHPDLVQKYQVISIPSLVLFRNGQKLSTIVGTKPQATLQAMINNLLNYA